jgi:hypothetical protein
MHRAGQDIRAPLLCPWRDIHRPTIGLATLAMLFVAFTYHKLDPLTCSQSELTSETVNPFRHFGRTPSKGDRLIARPLNNRSISTVNVHQDQ